MRFAIQRSIRILFVVALVAGCRTAREPERVVPTPAQAGQIEALFARRGLPGCIVVEEPACGLRYSHNPERTLVAHTPASTFKIFNSLVALETGAIGDVDEMLPWTGTKHEIAAWNRDTNLRRGIRDSVVWFYQALARRIGRERMQHYLDRVGYGNRTMGAPIDRFWLDGALRITPRQQIEFLRRLHAGDLPFSKRTMDAVKQIMVREQGSGYTVRAKTGWGIRFEDKVGWYVGWVETRTDRRVVFFALSLRVERGKDLGARVELAMETLRILGVL